jgi:hypothetical protein
MKLSKAQQELLDAFKNKNDFLHHMPYMGRFRPHPYYFMSGTMKHYKPVVVKKLLDLKLLEIFNDNGYGNYKVRKTK